MTAVVAVVCPHPPLLVPAMAGRAAWEFTELRAACESAIDGLCAAEPDEIVVVGGSAETRRYGPSAIGSFAGYGLALALRLRGATVSESAGEESKSAGENRLPLSLSVGAWLLRDRPDQLPRVGQSVATSATAAACAALGASLASRAARVGLLIMGDGSACHGEKSPGYDDPRAPAFDAEVTNALARCDTGALRALDIEVAAELLVAGRAPWQVLAGAVDASGGNWVGSVAYADAPYGVHYTVATWLPADVPSGRPGGSA